MFFVTVCVCVNSYCSITSWRLRPPGRLFVQQSSERTSAQKSSRKLLFCNHSEIVRAPTPPPFICQGADARFGRHFVASLLHKKLPTTLQSSKECTEAKSCRDSYDTCLLQLRREAEKRSLILSVAPRQHGLLFVSPPSAYV